MVYPRKTVMNFARKLDVLCHAWVGENFCTSWTLSDLRLCGLGRRRRHWGWLSCELKGAYALAVCLSDLPFCPLKLYEASGEKGTYKRLWPPTKSHPNILPRQKVPTLKTEYFNLFLNPPTGCKPPYEPRSFPHPCPKLNNCSTPVLQRISDFGRGRCISYFFDSSGSLLLARQAPPEPFSRPPPMHNDPAVN